MCILFIAVKQHPQYPLIIAANRDEFYRRPTKPSGFWAGLDGVLAGKDEQAGGTWMGVSHSGKVAALTNIRAPQTLMENARSRGELVLDYLVENVADTAYLAHLRKSAEAYNGYNLLYGNWHDLKVYNNHTDTLEPLQSGFYGLSNADLNSPWPKINAGVQALEQHCQSQDELDCETLFQLLRDESKAEDHLLPSTGVPYQWEKQLSSIFINTPEYGTRSSTLLLVDRDAHVTWHERSYDEEATVTANKTYQFDIKA